MTWAAGVLRTPQEISDPIVTAASRAAVPLLPQMQMGDIARMCWGLALLGRCEPGLLAAISKTVKSKVPKQTDRDSMLDLPMIVWSFARLGHDDSLILAMAASRLSRTGVTGISTWGVASLLWALRQSSGGSGAFGVFQQALRNEAIRRGLTEDQVSQAHLDPEEWKSDF